MSKRHKKPEFPMPSTEQLHNFFMAINAQNEWQSRRAAIRIYGPGWAKEWAARKVEVPVNA